MQVFMNEAKIRSGGGQELELADQRGKFFACRVGGSREELDRIENFIGIEPHRTGEGRGGRVKTAGNAVKFTGSFADISEEIIGPFVGWNPFRQDSLSFLESG